MSSETIVDPIHARINLRLVFNPAFSPHEHSLWGGAIPDCHRRKVCRKAAGARAAINEAEIDRLAAADEAGREPGEAASPRISDGIDWPWQKSMESGHQFSNAMQVTGIHPVAAAFPAMDRPAYEELVESIRVHGLRQPIILTWDELVVDGVNRLRACGEASVEPVFETLPNSDDEEAISNISPTPT